MTFVPEFSNEEQQLIDSEFKRFGDNTYLDHAGTTLYSEAQVENAAHTLQKNVFCNPHTCRATGDLLDQVRFKVLNFFNTNSEDYHVVFTYNATAALKLVAECFQFQNDAGSAKGNFYYCQDNHTSVLGMRSIVRTDHMFVITKEDIIANLENLQNIQNGCGNVGGNSLVVYSAQCNFSGYKLPLDTIGKIRKNGLRRTGMQVNVSNDRTVSHNHKCYVYLDAASYVSTSFLDLDKYKPDFVCLSFYKMFGYPTGVGALLVRRGAESVLEKRFYGGGTIDFAFTDTHNQSFRETFHTRFEDGTLPFLAIAGLLEGFRTIERLVPSTSTKRSIERISVHVHRLAKYCHDQLANLRHANGTPVVKFYTYADYDERSQQGGVVTFNLLNDVGTYVGYAEVACIAALHNIMLRTGCFCNLGACKSYLELDNDTVLNQYKAGRICGDFNDLINGQPTGAVRISFGYMTRLTHVDRLLSMIRECYVSKKSSERFRIIAEGSQRLPPSLKHIPDQLRPKVVRLCIYPVKSCCACKIDSSWEVTEQGFKYDRQWMIVDKNGMPVIQKHHRRLCMIRPNVNTDKGVLELSFEGLPTVTVPLELNANASAVLCQTKVCKTPILGQDCGIEVSDWLSNCLEIEGLRLIKQSNAQQNVSKELSFANQGQFLMINIASVRWLANKLQSQDEPLDTTIDRFRANIIIESNAPFDENSYSELDLNGVRFLVDGNCTRCEMICINQDTGETSPELLRTLAREFSGKIAFGIYISLDVSASKPLPETVIKCGEHFVVTRR